MGRSWLRIAAALGEAHGSACLHGGTYLSWLFSVAVRFLLLAALALAVVALGATREPHEGCDYDFGAGNGTAYLVVNNPYNLNLSLIIIHQIGERKNSTVLNVLNTRVIAFCGLGHGWLYVQQHEAPPGTPLAWYPLAVPRYAVLRAGESATMFVTTLLAPAATIAAVFLLLVTFTLRPRLKRSAVYAIPDELRGKDIKELIPVLLLILVTSSISLPAVYEWPLIHESDLTDIISILIMYSISSLGSFYLSFHRGLFAYYFILVGFFIDIALLINYLKSPLVVSLFIVFYIGVVYVYFQLRTLAIAFLSFYNLFTVFLLSTYVVAVFIYYDVNFGRIIPWSLPLQIPVVLPEVLAVIFPIIVVLVMVPLLLVMFFLVYSLTIHAPAVMTYKVFWPPLWWWFGLGIFALDELSARSILHRLSASGTVVVKLSRGERAFVVSADLYGVYLCKFGRRGGVCNNVEYVRYDELKVEAYRINWRSIDEDSVCRFFRKVMLPIFTGVSTSLTIQSILYGIIIQSIQYGILIILSIIFYYIYYKKGYIDNDSRELEEYIQVIKRDRKLLLMAIKIHTLWSLSISLIFSIPILMDLVLKSKDVLTLHLAAFVCIFLIAVISSVLLRADPKWSRYLFPWLELRLMSLDGLVIGLVRGGCLQRTKVGVAPRGYDIVIWDKDCEVVVSPYVEHEKSGPRHDLCGLACPPLRFIGEGRVALRVVDRRKEKYYYYVVESYLTPGKSISLFEYLA